MDQGESGRAGGRPNAAYLEWKAINGWSVRGSIPLDWQVSSGSDGLAAILPRMVTDIVLDPLGAGRRVVVDTKFTSILATNRFFNARLKSGYLYQMYAYLRSQEGRDTRWDGATGMFLHPAVFASLRERAVIQNHSITFATIDLSGEPTAIRSELRSHFCVAAEDWAT